MAEVVVGIDFGSTLSGFAYAFKGNQNEIIHGLTYGANFEHKFPTEIILDDSNKIISFGAECKKYLIKYGLRQDHYFKEIKSHLYKKAAIIQAYNSEKKFPLELIIQRFLEKLKDLAIYQIKILLPYINNNNIKYVVAIPAIWEDFQKDIMMKACINAGLIKEEDDKTLFFCLESEAALYYCLNNKNIDEELTKEGSYYIICDLGEETSNIMTYLFGFKENANEINETFDIQFGSNEINKIFFEEIILNIFGCKDFNSYYKKYKEFNSKYEEEEKEEEEIYCDWNELEKEVNDFKEGTNLKTFSEYYPINFSLFRDIFIDDIDLNDLVKKYNENIYDNELKLKIKNKKKWVIYFPHKIIYNYIKKQANSICEVINNILKRTPKITSIILVGSYSNNEVLISEIKNQLSNKISYFLQPSNPGVYKMEGAVLFGLYPYKIRPKKAYNQRILESQMEDTKININFQMLFLDLTFDKLKEKNYFYELTKENLIKLGLEKIEENKDMKSKLYYYNIIIIYRTIQFN